MNLQVLLNEVYNYCFHNKDAIHNIVKLDSIGNYKIKVHNMYVTLSKEFIKVERQGNIVEVTNPTVCSFTFDALTDLIHQINTEKRKEKEREALELLKTELKKGATYANY